MKKTGMMIVMVVLALVVFVGCTADAADAFSADKPEQVNVDKPEDTETSVDLIKSTATDSVGAEGALLTEDTLTYEQMMNYAIQDEYLARQTYGQILNVYGDVTPFRNIILAEDYHIELLTGLFDAYGFVVPKNASLDNVVEPRSFEEALQVGVIAERDNIAMYEKFLTYELPDDVRAAFEDLKSASEAHLAAFERSGGGGNGKGNGNGNGNGSGGGKNGD